jgi:dihydrofolate synthase / folylpolyglutamate synthase
MSGDPNACLASIGSSSSSPRPASPDMAYADAIRFLYDLQLFGLKLGLETTFKLAALAGNPHHRLRFIHVAGTNGKGSTCAMLESIYRAAGLKVGLFTSPHLVSFRERIEVNRQLISEADVMRLVAELQEFMKPLSADHHPTFFEVVTVMALRYFEEQRCDLVIWETGMGGRLDATNIVTPLASVITNIQFDHQQWLGDTHARIAAEKAGIIKPGVPVITATDEPDALQVIAATAKERRAPLALVRAAEAHSALLESVSLPLLGEHQRLNAAVASATVRALSADIAVPETTLRDGLCAVRWPGRLQQIRTRADQLVLLDGAHNVAGAASLRAALARHFPGKEPTLILGILADKDWQLMCAALSPLARRILLVPVKSDRSAAPAELLPLCASAHPAAKVQALGSLAEALARSRSDPFILVAGSLYLVGEALELLHASPVHGPGERALNEWGPGAQRGGGTSL